MKYRVSKFYQTAFVILALILNPFRSSASGADLLLLQKAEKISLALTGDVLTDVERLKLLSQTFADPSEETSYLKKLALDKIETEAFTRHFAEFWVRQLGVTAGLDLYSIRNVDNISISGFTRAERINLTFGRQDLNANHFIAWSNRAKKDSTAKKTIWAIKGCYNQNVIVTDNKNNPSGYSIEDNQSLYLIAPTINISRAGLFQYDQQLRLDVLDREWHPIKKRNSTSADDLSFWSAVTEMVQTYKERADPPCGNDWHTITPWFDPQSKFTYKASPEIFDACGPALIRCDLDKTDGSVWIWDRFRDVASYEMTMEPGFLIGHAVSHHQPFKTILTQTKTVLGSTLGFVLQRLGTDSSYNTTWNGKKLTFWDSFPGGAYRGLNAGMSIFGNKLHVVERTPDHAGVLTTPTFMLLSNGHRAMAHRAYKTFLCQAFKVPEGISPDPTDTRADLTERTYCSACHKTLDPMAAFFGRWPDTSNMPNYRYYSQPLTENHNINDDGHFYGKKGKGARGLAEILANTEDFLKCSVIRSFEFLNQRPPTEAELQYTIPKYTDLLKTSDQDLAKVLVELTVAPEFIQRRDGGMP